MARRGRFLAVRDVTVTRRWIVVDTVGKFVVSQSREKVHAVAVAESMNANPHDFPPPEDE